MDIYQYQALWNTLVTLFLFICSVFYAYIAHNSARIKNYYGGVSSFSTAVILMVFSVYNNIFRLFKWPYIGFYMYWTGAILMLHIAFWFLVKRNEKVPHQEKSLNLNEFHHQNKKYHQSITKSQEKRNYPEILQFPGEDEPERGNDIIEGDEKYADSNVYHKKIPLKMEYYRKSWHLFGFLIIAAFYGLGGEPLTVFLNNLIVKIIGIPPVRWLYEDIWLGVDLYSYSGASDQIVAQDLMFFGLFSALSLVVFSDFIRILVGIKYSLFSRVTRSVLRSKELKSAGPHVFLIVGSSFAFFIAHLGFWSYDIAMAAIVTACFSDAIAAIIGRTYGKHKLLLFNDEEKSIEGFLAGAMSAVFFSSLILGPFYGIIAGLIFFIIDYYPIHMADNLLNPIMISLGMQLFFAVTGFPLGW